MSKVNAGQAPSTLIPEYIGSDFDAVLSCADNMVDLKTVVGNLNDLTFIANNMGVVNVVAAHVDAVEDVADSIGDVSAVAPHIDDVDVVANNIEYVKDVAEGIAGLPVVSYSGPTPPPNPTVGAEWYCTTDGRSYVYYMDADSTQWVESSPQSTIGVSDTFALWKRSLAEIGLTLVGTFQEGCTVTAVGQAVLDFNASQAYQWKGTIPVGGKVIPVNSTPATAGGVSPTAWVDRTDGALWSELAAADGAALVGGLPFVSPLHFGGVPGGLIDATQAINDAIAKCELKGYALDLRGGPWLFSAQLDFTSVATILCDYKSELVCNPTGFTAPTASGIKFAVVFGEYNSDPHTGRCVGASIVGSLVVRSLNRVTALDGIYIKGSFINAGHIRAVNFNGHGVCRDSVWDSTFQRISVELCGNTAKHAYWHSSTGDTSNASHTVSLQVEQAYHKGFYIAAIRDVISNIHAERLYQLTSNDGSLNIDGSAWLNSHISLSNSCLMQMICDSATVNPPTGESIVSGQTYRITVGGVNLTASSVVVAGSVLNSYGSEITMHGLICSDFISNAPAKNITLTEPNIVTLSAEKKITINGGSVYNMRAQFNAAGHSYNNVTIDNINFTNNILGDIDFKSCDIRLVTDTKIASSASKAPVEFYGCTIQEYQGAYNSRANIHGGYIHLFSLVSQGLPHCFTVKFGTFSPTGNSGYLTRGCTADSISSWTQPTNVNYPAGTITERVGYDVAGKLYQNTDGALTWVKLA